MLAAFGLVVLYILGLGVLMLPFLIIYRDNDLAVIIMVLTVLVLGSAGLIPYINFISKTVFRYRGEGPIISPGDLRAQLLEVNDFDVPVMVEGRGNKLVFTWRYVDARWWELMAKSGMTGTYELHVKLDPRRHRATLIDVNKSVSWGAGPGDVHLKGGFFRGVNMEVEIGKQWGIRENFRPGKIYDYKFTPMEIKTPVMNTILRNGWDVLPGMW